MKKLNREWHLDHPLSANPTPEQRAKWQHDHDKHCPRRPMPRQIPLDEGDRPDKSQE